MSYDGTIRLGDVNGDGRAADLCLRGTLSPAPGTGLRCYFVP